MGPVDINIPEVVAEVTAVFTQYEQALTANDVPTLDSLFWNDSRVIRYACGRVAREPASTSSGRSCAP